MDVKIQLNNALLYNDKTSGKAKTRIGYVMFDENYLQFTDKFKGYNELSAFYDGVEVFNKIPNEFFGQVVTAHIDTRPNPGNPLKEYKLITELELDKNVICLL